MRFINFTAERTEKTLKRIKGRRASSLTIEIYRINKKEDILRSSPKNK